MAYKILTKNGIDNTNIDGARGEYFNSGMRDGIVQGVLNEGTFIASSSNVISLDTCELRIAGHRIVIDEPVYHTFSNAPRTDTRYAFVAQIIVGSDQSVEFSLFVQTANTSLIQNDLYKTISGAGTYQVEIGRFTLTQSLLIEDVVRTIDVITGGTGGNSGDYIKIGQVTTTTTASGTMANVDIENVERQGEMQTDFNFDIPAPIGTAVVVNGEEQESVSFKSDPQTQINQLSNPNLLINGDFSINQRGQTSYSGLNVGAGIYGIDRFKMIECNLAVNTDNTITITNYKNYGRVIQQLEFANELKGKTVTLSVKFKNVSYTRDSDPRLIINDGINNTFSQPIPNGFSGIFSVSKTLAQNSTALQVRIIHNNLIATNSDLSATIEWAKLEVGSVATPFSPRPYAEELALCQRYYQKCSPSNSYAMLGTGIVFSSSAIVIGVSLPVTLRTAPTITANGNFYLRTTSATYTTSDNALTLSPSGLFNNVLQLEITSTNTTFTSGDCAVLRVSENTAYLSLDAEIY